MPSAASGQMEPEVASAAADGAGAIATADGAGAIAADGQGAIAADGQAPLATPDGRPAEPTPPQSALLSSLPGDGPLSRRLAEGVGAGRPVAILPWHEGLVAISADGARRFVLSPGPVRWAMVDELADVVWFSRVAPDPRPEPKDGAAPRPQAELLALDLRASGVSVTTLVRGLPADAELVIQRPAAGASGAPTNLTLQGGREGVAALIVDEGNPRIEAWDGVLIGVGLQDAAEHARAVGRAELTEAARDRVRELARRVAEAAREPRASPPRRADLPDRLDVPFADPDCGDACGQWLPFGGTALVAVVVASSCGDTCYSTWSLYDPAKKVFVSTIGGPDSPRPVGDGYTLDPYFQVHPDGALFIEGGAIYRLGASPIEEPALDGARRHQALGGGWLSP